MTNEIQYVKVGFTNCFLLSCKEGYLLIDTSHPGKYKLFVKELKKIDIDISDIKYLLLTHHHDDHAGFAAELVKNTGTKIIVHQKALPFLKKGESESTSKPLNTCIRIILGFFSLFHKFVFPPIMLKEDDYIINGDDSEILTKIGIDGKILHTPGHTEDSISVLLSDGKAFVGDAAMNFMNICRIKHRPIFVQDIEEVYKSWEKLAEYGAKTIYPAHGKPFSVEELFSHKR